MPTETTTHTAGVTKDSASSEREHANLSAASIPGSASAPDGLDEIYRALSQKAERAMTWYALRQVSMRRGARWTRVGAIALGALATIFPSLIALLPDRLTLLGAVDWPVVRLNPLATIFGVLAGTAILFDKFYGYSSGWIRYVATYQEIQGRLEQFRIDWHKWVLKLNANHPLSGEQIGAAYDFFAAFLTSVNSSIGNETQAWVSEFKGALAEIDRAVESQRAAAAALQLAVAKGALNVSIDNIAAVDRREWTLQLDNRQPEIKLGQATASIPLLDPGLYKVSVAGQKDGRACATETTILVKAGEIFNLKVTLE